MEFDNDRIRKKSYKTETACWIIFALMSPLVNAFSFFMADLTGDKLLIFPADVFILLLLSLFTLPAYIFYSKVLVPDFLFKKRISLFILFTAATYISLQLFLWAVYSLVLQFDLTPTEHAYLSINYSTVIRENLWCVFNFLLATGIAMIKKGLDEKDFVRALQNEHNFYKLRYLRTQLNPHFLFNTLNSVYSLSLQRSDKTPEVIVKLADIMRYLIYECNEEKILLSKEIEFIRNYIEIEKLRHDADVQFIVEGETEGIMVEPFLFISFIENGFKHALDNTVSRPFIYITLKVEAEQIKLNVINNTNMDLETQAKRISGKGISNSKSLLELLYPDAYELDIIQTEKEERKNTGLRLKHAKERLESLYPDTHTLDVILSNNAFTVSLIIKPAVV